MLLNIKFYGTILVFFAAFIAFLPTAGNELIMDDYHLVGQNEKIKSISGITYYFKNSIFAEERTFSLYRPALMASLVVNRILTGGRPFSYHLANLFLHGLAAVLLFHLLSSLLGYSARSLIPALLFAVHPIQADTVAFVINRSDILALIFILSGLMILMKNAYWKNFLTLGRSSNSLRPMAYKVDIPAVIASSLFFFLGALSKETALAILPMMFLFVLLKIFYVKEAGSSKPVITLFLGMFVFTAIYLALRSAAVGGIVLQEYSGPFEHRSFCTVFPTMARVFRDYVFLLFAPVSLSVDYNDYLVSRSCVEWSAILSYLLHAVIIVACLYGIKRRSVFPFIVLSFYVFLIPVSQIIPFLSIKAERFLYVPSIFFCLLISFPLRNAHGKPSKRRKVLLFYALLTTLYLSLSLSYSALFVSEKSLFSAMAERFPQNAQFHFALGDYMVRTGEPEEGIPHLLQALRIEKNYVKAYSSLAIAYHRSKKYHEAKEIFRKGLDLFPNYTPLVRNYAVFNYENADYTEALVYINRAHNLKPGNHEIAKIKEMIEARVQKAGGE